MAGEKKVAKDTYLFRENDQPDAMYIVKNGSLAVTKSKGSQEIALAEVGPGQMVGEMALFDLKPRSANVKATKDSEVIVLPYNGLLSQLETLPTWVKAIMRTLNDNMREANKKIRLLENPGQDEDRYPPHVVNRLISIINLVGQRWGVKEEKGLNVPPVKLRNFTIQVFQEATNKMTSMLNALAELGFLEIEGLGEGRQKITNFDPEFLFGFVDWYNEWLFKQEKDRSPALTAEECKTLGALLHFGEKVAPNDKGFVKVNVNDIQNDSMKEVGFLVKVEDFNSVIEKKLIAEKMMEANGVFITFHPGDLKIPTKYWTLIHSLKKQLK